MRLLAVPHEPCAVPRGAGRCARAASGRSGSAQRGRAAARAPDSQPNRPRQLVLEVARAGVEPGALELSTVVAPQRAQEMTLLADVIEPRAPHVTVLLEQAWKFPNRPSARRRSLGLEVAATASASVSTARRSLVPSRRTTRAAAAASDTTAARAFRQASAQRSGCAPVTVGGPIAERVRALVPSRAVPMDTVEARGGDGRVHQRTTSPELPECELGSKTLRVLELTDELHRHRLREQLGPPGRADRMSLLVREGSDALRAGLTGCGSRGWPTLLPSLNRDGLRETDRRSMVDGTPDCGEILPSSWQRAPLAALPTAHDARDRAEFSGRFSA